MKLKIIAALLLASASTHAVTISQWTFETNTPADLNNSAAFSGIAADIGNGTASGSHASASTDWSTPVGNGSANSLSANTWAVGDYWQFQVSTIGFENISLSWDQASSGTGPRDFGLFYSFDGSAFSQFGSAYTVLANASPNPLWSATHHSEYSFNSDLSSITGLNEDASVFFRLIVMSNTNANGGTVASSGTSRIDNFTVSGTAKTSSVPETLSFPFIALFLVSFVFLSRYFISAPKMEKAKIRKPVKFGKKR